MTDERARLDNFAVELQNSQNLLGYVIAYAGRRARANEALTNAADLKAYLIKKRGVAPNRVVVMDGGHCEEASIELYLVPRDLPPPVPTPTLAKGEVQIIKTKNNRGIIQQR